MRKFSPPRLYKITKVFVIIVTVIAALIAAWEISIDLNQSFENSKFSFEIQCQNTGDPHIKEIYSGCIQQMDNIWQGAIDLKNHSILVAIFLPIFFFGGTRLYKYLFPKNE